MLSLHKTIKIYHFHITIKIYLVLFSLIQFIIGFIEAELCPIDLNGDVKK